MAGVQLIPLELPISADASRLHDFGREVKGVDPADIGEAFPAIEEALYRYGALLFRDTDLTPDQQYALVQKFDPKSSSYGHGNKKVDANKGSILNSYINSIPATPQVQLIGHGTLHSHEGIAEITLKHGHHSATHKTLITREDEAKGYTRFFRWHMDAALYALEPPKVTALYGIKVPQGPAQTVRYDDGSGDELQVPLGTTAFASGKVMYDILPRELKSVAIRARAKYAPRPFEWISSAKAKSTGLGLEVEGMEKHIEGWKEEEVKVYPFTWKNPVTGHLHLMVHGWGVKEVLIDALPSNAKKDGMFYPDGAHLTDLQEVRALVYSMHRPGIAPSLVYPHPWQEKDLMLFHNRGLMHSVVGTFKSDQVRVFHQCNLAGSDAPVGPSIDDVRELHVAIDEEWEVV